MGRGSEGGGDGGETTGKRLLMGEEGAVRVFKSCRLSKKIQLGENCHGCSDRHRLEGHAGRRNLDARSVPRSAALRFPTSWPERQLRPHPPWVQS